MSSRYAAHTKVPIERSRAEIERVLAKYGCDAFVSGWSNEGAIIQFSHKGRSVRISVPYDNENRERAERQRWRILLLLVKAQLEAVECGLLKFEEAFLPWMVLKSGATVYETMLPQLPAEAATLRLKGVRP